MANLYENIQKPELLPGFRFHPTDEELIIYYLFQKTLDSSFTSFAVGEADLKKVEPWELPWKANMGEEEWYFFCLRERRYPTGQRTNRGTASGYWKATGKDKEIFGAKSLVGMKKTLVFYTGRAPKGVKSNWVMHEFRLDGIYSKDNLPDTAQSEWVISKVFNKNASGKKTHISDLQKPNSEAEDIDHQHQPSTSLPPLTESSPRSISFETKPTFPINQPSSFAPEIDDSSSFSFKYCTESFFNHNDQSIFKFLIDEDGDGNDLLSSLKLGKSEDTGPSGSGDGGGGSDLGDGLATRDPFDIDYLINC